MVEIYLLRHGQTAWNKDRIFRGRADVPLDDHGLAQAECAVQALGNTPLVEIHSSPLSRAVQTAQPTANAKNLPVKEAPELLDIDYGQWTGKSQVEIEKLFPELNRQWLQCPEQVHFPNGEDLSAVRERAFAYLLTLVRTAGDGAILLVSHRVVLKVLICAALELGLSKFWQVKLDTASLSVLSFEKNRFTLSRLNDTCHLQELGGAGESVDF